MTLTRTALAAGALLLTLAACSSDDEPNSDPSRSATGSTGISEDDGTPEAADFGQAHSIDGLDISADATEIFAPNDYANFGDDNPYALITLTVTNTGDADSDALSGPLHGCQLDGTTASGDQFQGITEMPPGLIHAGDTVTWLAHACPVTTSDGARGGTLDYSVTVNGSPVWFTGPIPAE